MEARKGKYFPQWWSQRYQHWQATVVLQRHLAGIGMPCERGRKTCKCLFTKKDVKYSCHDNEAYILKVERLALASDVAWHGDCHPFHHFHQHSARGILGPAGKHSRTRVLRVVKSWSILSTDDDLD